MRPLLLRQPPPKQPSTRPSPQPSQPKRPRRRLRQPRRRLPLPRRLQPQRRRLRQSRRRLPRPRRLQSRRRLQPQPPTPTRAPTPTPTPAPTPTTATDLASVVERVRLSVVQVLTNSSTGSGVIVDVDNDGRAVIVTNHHVIEVGGTVNVLVNDANPYPATILGFDARKDLAVLSICCSTGFRASRLSSQTELPAGSTVFTMGYPLGVSRATVTRGIVSAVWFDQTTARWLVQTDAAINRATAVGRSSPWTATLWASTRTSLEKRCQEYPLRVSATPFLLERSAKRSLPCWPVRGRASLHPHPTPLWS